MADRSGPARAEEEPPKVLKDAAAIVGIGETPFAMRLEGSETRLAIESAHAAFKRWKARTGIERGLVLRKWYELILEHKNDLATILTLEQGKPIDEAHVQPPQ